jgi:hypothetical protein
VAGEAVNVGARLMTYFKKSRTQLVEHLFLDDSLLPLGEGLRMRGVAGWLSAQALTPNPLLKGEGVIIRKFLVIDRKLHS